MYEVLFAKRGLEFGWEYAATVSRRLRWRLVCDTAAMRLMCGERQRLALAECTQCALVAREVVATE